METKACLKVRKNKEVSPDWVEMNLPTVGGLEEIELDGGPRNATSLTAMRSQASPIRPTLKDCFLYSCHEWRCACLTLTIVLCLIGTIFCYLWRHMTNVPLESTRMHSWICCQTTYIAIGAALVFLFYLVYLIECWNCPVWLSASCMVDSNTAYSWINFLRLSVPSIYWHVNCYHYESGQEATKVETHLAKKLSKVDVNGIDTKTVNTTVCTTRPCKQTGARCGKVITASGIHVFDTSQLEGVWDYSDTVIHLERYPMVQIEIHTDYVFADEASSQLFTYQRQQFFTNFEDIDEYMETHQKHRSEHESGYRASMFPILICFIPIAVQFTEKGPLPSRIWITSHFPQIPVCLRQTTFFLAALLLLSFPLRVWIHCRMARVNCTIRKVFGRRPSTTNGIVSNICHTEEHKTGGLSNFPSDRLDMTKLPSTANNEAIVLCNQEFSLCTNSSDKRRLPKMKKDHVKDDEDDEELLSLDIRYEEFVKGGCTLSDEIVHNKYVTDLT